MRELSLFTGAGFGVLGTKLLGWRTIGYVEVNDYCQRIISQRIKDGIFDPAPVFGDVRDFIFSGAAQEYEGIADVVTAGFPCQPFSKAGKNRGANDDRNLFPELLRIIRTVRPKHLLLENVPNLLAHEYIRTIFGELAALGYDCRWDCISAAACGAPHKRDRLWIFAERRSDALQDAERVRRPNETSEERRIPAGSFGNAGAGSDQRLSGIGEEVAGRHAMADSDSKRKLQSQGTDQDERGRFGDGSEETAGRRTVADASGIGMEGNRPIGIKESGVSPGQEISGRDSAGGRTTYWKTEPRVGRLVDGCPDRVHRLRSAGNGQVPIVVATAWRLLSE